MCNVKRCAFPLHLPFYTSFPHPPGGHRRPGHGRRNPGLLPAGTGRQGSFVPLVRSWAPLVTRSRRVPGNRRGGASEITAVCPVPPLAVLSAAPSRGHNPLLAPGPRWRNLPLVCRCCSGPVVGPVNKRHGSSGPGVGVRRAATAFAADARAMIAEAGAVGDPTSRDRTGSGPFSGWKQLVTNSTIAVRVYTVFLVSGKTTLVGPVGWGLGKINLAGAS